MIRTSKHRVVGRLIGGVAIAAALLAVAAAEGAIPGIGPAGSITRAHTGFTFTEGPAADLQGNVYFTDVRAGRIHRAGVDGTLTTVLEESQGANGLMFDGRGRLLACQGAAGRIIAIDVASGEFTVVAAGYQGRPFNRPNDLVVDRQGGVYFTDPLFGPGDMNQDKMAVYYVAADGQVTRLIDDLPRPNGVILSPDEKTLYVLPSGTPAVMAYEVLSPGRIGAGRELARLRQAASGAARGGDGLTVDSRGNLYCTQPGASAIQVFSPDGKMLGEIEFPEAPANCTFGGPDMKTLYVTARTSLYTVPMEAKGHRFAAAP